MCHTYRAVVDNRLDYHGPYYLRVDTHEGRGPTCRRRHRSTTAAQDSERFATILRVVGIGLHPGVVLPLYSRTEFAPLRTAAEVLTTPGYRDVFPTCLSSHTGDEDVIAVQQAPID